MKMKNYLLIFIAVLLFSCTKGVEVFNRKSNSSGYTFTLAQSNHATISKGVQSTMDVQKLGNESGRSVWVSCYIGDVFVQVGYDSKARYLFQHYYGTLNNIQIINPVPVINERQKNTFAIKNIEGLQWAIIVNGLTILTFEGSTDVCWRIRTGIEYGGSNQRFPLINFNPAFELWNGGNWEVPTGAIVSHRGKWGIEATSINNINMGGSVPSVPIFNLW